MLVPLNGPSGTVLSTHPQSSATSAGRSGQPVTTTAYRILPLKVNPTKKGRSKAPASIYQPHQLRASARRNSPMAIFGVQRMNLTMEQNQPLLPPVDGTIRLILKMQLCRAPRKEERRRKKRRIGGQERRMHIRFPRNRASGESRRRRRRGKAGLRRPVTTHEIRLYSFLKMLRVVCMVNV